MGAVALSLGSMVSIAALRGTLPPLLVGLFVGTDSGFEGRTSIHYDRIELVLSPQG